jgi:hypothetical protein
MKDMEIFNWQGINFGVATIIFLAYILTDSIYALYTMSVNRQRPWVAANASALIHILLAFGVLSYVQNFLYVIPIALGSWIGTFIVVYRDFRVGSEKFVS